MIDHFISLQSETWRNYNILHHKFMFQILRCIALPGHKQHALMRLASKDAKTEFLVYKNLIGSSIFLKQKLPHKLQVASNLQPSHISTLRVKHYRNMRFFVIVFAAVMASLASARIPLGYGSPSNLPSMASQPFGCAESGAGHAGFQAPPTAAPSM